MQRGNENRYIKQGRRLYVLIFQLHKNHYLHTDNTYKTDTDRRKLSEELQKSVKVKRIIQGNLTIPSNFE